MRTLTVLSAFLLGLGVVLVVANQDVQAQDQPVYSPAPPQMQPPGGEARQFDPSPWQQPGGGTPPWAQGGGPPPGGAPPWMMQQGGQQPGGARGPGGRGGPPPGVTQQGRGYQPGAGGVDANRAAMMIGRLRSMDANGNGILEPQEISDSRRSFVNAIVTQMGGDPNGSIDLARLERRAVRNAETQANNAQQQPDSTSRRQSRESTQPVDPLVPAFGEPKPAETPTLGFGQRGAATQQDSSAGRVSGGQRPNSSTASTAAANQPRTANKANTIKRSSVYDAISEAVRNNPRFNWFFDYDANQDGQLTMPEYVRGQGGVWTAAIAKEFRLLDRNDDGFVTVDEALTTIKEWDEMAVQKAKEQQETTTTPPQATERPPARPSSSSGRTPREGYQGNQGRPSSASGSSGNTSGRDRRSWDRQSWVTQ